MRAEISRKPIVKENYEYVYIQPDGNIRLLVPLSMGFEIGTDNTCKSAYEIKKFFGENGAFASLTQLKHDLELQQLFVASASDEATRIEQQLIQITAYLALIDFLATDVRSINSLVYDVYPYLPEGVTEALRMQHQNAIAILLAPPEEDSWTRFVHYKVAFSRLSDIRKDSDEGLEQEHQNTFGSNLHYLLKGIEYHLTEEQLPTKERVIRCVCQQLPLQLCTIPATVKTVMLLVREATAQIAGQQLPEVLDTEVTEISESLCYDNPDDFEAREEFVKSVYLGMQLDESAWKQQGASVFNETIHEIITQKQQGDENVDNTIEQLIIQIQFYLACMNIYVTEQGIFNEDIKLAKLYDELEYDLLGEIFGVALTEGESVEDAFIYYLNDQMEYFRLKRPCSNDDKKAINELYLRLYSQIKDSPHFDEFLIYRPQQEGGDFCCYQGRIGLDLYRFCNYQLAADDSEISANAVEAIHELLKRIGDHADAAMVVADQQRLIVDEVVLNSLALNLCALEGTECVNAMKFVVMYLATDKLVGSLFKKLGDIGLELSYYDICHLVSLIPEKSNLLLSSLLAPAINTFELFQQTYESLGQWGHWPQLVSKLNYRNIITNPQDLSTLLAYMPSLFYIKRIFETISYTTVFTNVKSVAAFLGDLAPDYYEPVIRAFKKFGQYVIDNKSYEILEPYLPAAVNNYLYNQLGLMRHPSNPETVALFNLRPRDKLNRKVVDAEADDNHSKRSRL